MTSPAADLELQYSPSAWVRRVAPSDAVRLFAEAVTAAAQRARQSLRCQLDVRYGPGAEQRYSVLGTDVPDDAPLAVFIHGGYWQVGAKSTRTGRGHDPKVVPACVPLLKGISPKD